ncbi:MAG TPA: hypothetical protein VKA70_22330 [Blastocatellia bacterium]|nr:hypothetical protein [Blastocatellia bacterium]
MKRFAIILSLSVVCLAAAAAAFSQSYEAQKSAVPRGCEFNIVGTWKAEKADGATPIVYRFTPDAKVTVLSGQGSELREVASAAYSIDNPKAPKVVTVKADKQIGDFAQGATSMQIAEYDDTWVSLTKPGSAPTRWVRVDPFSYYIVLAGRVGTFYDKSGPTFPMMIKTDGHQTQVDAVGMYDSGRNGYWAFGAIPAETYNEFMKEPGKDGDIMLRLEITAAQYERGLKIVKSWDRRARNNELLYGDLSMNNILLVKQVTETLNQCGEKFKLYKLDWSMEDHISNSSKDSPALTYIPYWYFRELKRLNRSLHVPDAKFQGRTHQMAQQAAK